jgi:hypothetical protein
VKSPEIIRLIKLSPTYLALLLIIFFVNGHQASAQKKPVKKEKHFEAEIGFSTIYDNNILKYSDKYLDRFMNGQDPGRFHIETYDDIILNQSGEIAATYRIIKKLKTRFSANYFFNSYLTNNIKNWYFINVGLQQFITKKASFKIFYNYVPRFYVRHFRDDDWVEIYGYVPETFVQFSFTKENYGFWIQNTFFDNTRLRLSFDYAKYYHNNHYTEYDCKNYLYGASLYQPLHEKLRLELGYEYEYSDAKGYDEEGESKNTADDADATYYENGFAFGLNWKLPEIKKKEHDLDLKAAYQNRKYLSEHYLEEDPEHVSRVDNNVQVALTYNFNLNKYFTLSAFYKYYFRDSGAESEFNDLYVSAEKDYKQSQAGLKVVYNIKF